jgi:anti-sigma factor RsiW
LLTCKDFLRELNEFLDPSSTDPSARQELEKHVNECPICWVVVDTTKKTLKVFKGMQASEVPARIQDRLMAALERKMASRKSGVCGETHHAGE